MSDKEAKVYLAKLAEQARAAAEEALKLQLRAAEERASRPSLTLEAKLEAERKKRVEVAQAAAV